MNSNQLPPSPEIPEGLSQEEQADYLQQKAYAHNLKHRMAGTYLLASVSQVVPSEIAPSAYLDYIQEVLTEAGNPSDPLERMLIEQITLAHHAIGTQHVQAASAGTLQEKEMHLAAASRLLAEFRRCVLAVQQYRQASAVKTNKPSEKQDTSSQVQIKSQAVRRSRHTEARTPENNHHQGELGSNTSEQPILYNDVITQPTQSGGWQEKSGQERSSHGCCQGATETVCAC